MIRLMLSQLADVTRGELHGCDLAVDEVTSDTRKITAGCLFVALKGERFDAHDFAEQAKQAGAGALLVSRQLECDLPQVVVKDTRLAFGELAAWVSSAGAGPRCGADRLFRENVGERDDGGDSRSVRQYALYRRQPE